MRYLLVLIIPFSSQKIDSRKIIEPLSQRSVHNFEVVWPLSIFSKGRQEARNGKKVRTWVNEWTERRAKFNRICIYRAFL
jgi:hypothetical protein